MWGDEPDPVGSRRRVGREMRAHHQNAAHVSSHFGSGVLALSSVERCLATFGKMPPERPDDGRHAPTARQATGRIFWAVHSARDAAPMA